MNELQKEYEATGHTAWINSDIYPDGRIYTKEYTEWLEKKIAGGISRQLEQHVRPHLFAYTLNQNDSIPVRYMLVYCTDDEDGKRKLKQFIGDRKDDAGQKHGLVNCWCCTAI